MTPMTDRDQIAALLRLVVALTSRVSILEGKRKPIPAKGGRAKPALAPTTVTRWNDARQIISDLVTEAAWTNQISSAELLSKDQSFRIARPRQEIMRRANEAGVSYPTIARAFGMDRKTVYHGIAAAQARRGGGEGDG